MANIKKQNAKSTSSHLTELEPIMGLSLMSHRHHVLPRNSFALLFWRHQFSNQKSIFKIVLTAAKCNCRRIIFNKCLSGNVVILVGQNGCGSAVALVPEVCGSYPVIGKILK